VDELGPKGLTMRRLGAALGVDATTIYYYVPNKAFLEDLVVDAVMKRVDLQADDPEAPSAERVMTLVQALAAALLAHPRALPFLASKAFTTPASLHPIEHLLGILRDAGLDYPHAVAVVNNIFFYTLGAASARAAGLLDPELPSKALAALAALPEEEFPHVTAAARGAQLLHRDLEFELGARALVTGLLDEARRPQGGSDAGKDDAPNSRPKRRT
jgi:TetR/AcrR family transcriptional regulator, tetracycline repressor protein